ncbi:fumarylacetoacetase [Phenylobacterium sp. LjRoot164]|uniref:fumarylacetoacetase n=1 Tax=unclassified Phenylobacterium TaxID=2640670 RepID=UPI003ECD45AF
MTINATHDPRLKSWVASANSADTDFPIQNLPHGVFTRRGETPRGGVAIGDQILDIRAAIEAGLFEQAGPGVRDAAAAAAEPQLNRLMAMEGGVLSELRGALQALLAEGSADRARAQACLASQAESTVLLPARIGAFTDFMTSAPHIAAARPGRAQGVLPPCFWTLPIGYNSRASSIVASGQKVERPLGQYAVKGGRAGFGPARALDFELEFACYIGLGNVLGQPIHLSQARRQIFGYCVLNDWSARDVQVWESVLGPFQAKAFRTTVSPWVVTSEAMAPFRQPLPARPADAPNPPPHLAEADGVDGGLALRLQARLRTAAMRKVGDAPVLLSDTSFDASAWSFEQMITHHAIGGCNLETGDLLSSGTLSGEPLESAACLAEITGGRAAFELANGERRLWLEDGDEIWLSARAEREGFASIGFGQCRGEIAPAVEFIP